MFFNGLLTHFAYSFVKNAEGDWVLCFICSGCICYVCFRFLMYSEITLGVFSVHHVVKALSKYFGVLRCFVNTTRPLWELWEYHGNTEVIP